MRKIRTCATLLLSFVSLATASAEQHYLDLTTQSGFTTSGLPGSEGRGYEGYVRPAPPPPPLHLELEGAGLDSRGKPYIEFTLRNEGKGTYLLATSYDEIASLKQGCIGRHLVFVDVIVRGVDSGIERRLPGNALAGSLCTKGSLYKLEPSTSVTVRLPIDKPIPQKISVDQFYRVQINDLAIRDDAFFEIGEHHPIISAEVKASDLSRLDTNKLESGRKRN